MKTINVKVKGMHCASCETLIKDSLEEFGDVDTAEVSHKKGTVVVKLKGGSVDEDMVKQIIRNEGYEVE